MAKKSVMSKLKSLQEVIKELSPEQQEKIRKRVVQLLQDEKVESK